MANSPFNVIGGGGLITHTAIDGLNIYNLSLVNYNTFTLSGDSLAISGTNINISATNITINNLKYPNSDGDDGDVLTTDGSGNLTFQHRPPAPVTSVNTKTGDVVLITDNIDEGSNNLYYQDARVSLNSDVSANTTARHTHDNKNVLDSITDAGSGQIITSAERTKLEGIEEGAQVNTVDSINNKVGDVVLNTSDIDEGSNLYWTDQRFDNRFVNKSTDNLPEGSSNKYYKRSYFLADLNISSINELSDVDTSTISPSVGHILKWDGTNWTPSIDETGNSTSGDMLKSVYDPTLIEADAFDYNNFYNVPTDITDLSSHSVIELNNVSNAGSGKIITDTERTKLEGIEDGAQVNTVDSVNNKVGDVILTTNDIFEGTNGLYYTDERVDIRISLANIEDLNNVDTVGVLVDQYLKYNGTNWVASDVPESLVTSVFTRTGDIIAESGDYSADLITYDNSTSGLSSTDVQTAIDELNNDLNNINIPQTTDDLPEGTNNLYYTDTRVSTVISNTSINELSDVNTTLITPGIGDVLKWDGSNWVPSVDNYSTAGDMLKSVYDPTNIEDDVFNFNNFYNIPTDITDLSSHSVTELNDVTDSGSGKIITDIERTKLDGIEDGAEVNVNANWNSTSGDSEILNKPTDLTDLSSHSVTELNDVTNAGSGKIITDTERTKLDGIEDGAQVNTVDSVNSKTGIVILDTDDISEGSNNLYYTDTRVSTNSDVSANTNARHTHNNKTELDNITDAGSGQIITNTERTKLDGIEDGAEVNVNADWNSTSGDSEILNKPTDITDLSSHSVTELNDVTDSGSGQIITDIERTKLAGIEDGAEVNIQSDWNESSSSSDAFILNKPTDLTDLSSHSVTELNDITDAGSGKIITDTERTKLTGIEDGAEVNVNADWNSTSGDSEILNKPTDITDLSSHSVTELNDITDAGSGKIITDTERTKLTGIEDGAEVNVQSDWNETNSTSDAFILNKPTVPTNLDDLSDVDTTGVTTDNVLQYDGSMWKPATISTNNGDMLKSVYDPTNIEDDAFDFNNFYNVPTDITDLSSHSVTELNDVTDSGSGKIITDTERTKLDGIEDGAEVNIQSDWNETSSSSDAFILNKPTDLTDLSSHSVTELNDVTDSGSGQIITDTERTKLAGIEDGAEVNTVDSVNGETGTVILDTDDISEGSNNLYYTDVRVLSYINTLSIDELADVDTTTVTPSVGNKLNWDGSNWVVTKIEDNYIELFQDTITTSIPRNGNNTPIPWDGLTHVGSNFTFSSGDTEITVNTAGTYLIGYNITLNGTTSSRTSSGAEIQVNSNVIDGSFSAGYHRNSSDGYGTISKSIIISLNANDKVVIYVRVIDGRALETVDNGSSLSILKL